MSDTIAERVARGADLLDEERPGWWETGAGEIDLDDFDIDSPCRCILGQLWRGHGDDSYSHGVEALDLRPDGRNLNREFLYGFDGDYTDRPLLQAEWVRVITERREAS